MALTYWKCGKCGRVFTVTTLAHKHIKNSSQLKPHCPCGSLLTEKTHKEVYDNYHLKNEIERDKMIVKSLDVWFAGGSRSYLRNDKKKGR